MALQIMGLLSCLVQVVRVNTLYTMSKKETKRAERRATKHNPGNDQASFFSNKLIIMIPHQIQITIMLPLIAARGGHTFQKIHHPIKCNHHATPNCTWQRQSHSAHSTQPQTNRNTTATTTKKSRPWRLIPALSNDG